MYAEKLVEVWQITEWRDGCIYKTRYIEDKWVHIDAVNPEPRNMKWVPKSTSYQGQTFRVVNSKEEPEDR